MLQMAVKVVLEPFNHRDACATFPKISNYLFLRIFHEPSFFYASSHSGVYYLEELKEHVIEVGRDVRDVDGLPGVVCYKRGKTGVSTCG